MLTWFSGFSFPTAIAWAALALTGGALRAHQQPTTLVTADIGDGSVTLQLHVPLNELELAFGHEVTQTPERNLAAWSEPFRAYVLQHVRPVAANGQRWRVQVEDLRIHSAEQVQSGPFQEVAVRLVLTPPAGASSTHFTLYYDLILHQVVTHKALVSIRDWSAGQLEAERAGSITVNAGTGSVDPFVIHRGGSRWWDGPAAMVRLGMSHIREGFDHLLFLIMLLLPSTLSWSGKAWGGFGGGRYSLTRLIRIVTAFTIGHSATLLASALNWLQLPQQPVEVLIACSILVTAVHAIRPIFPGREVHVAAGFGLVHGLAFATVLTALNLSGARLAASILGFNVGIELMQLFVIAMTAPWLILLSLTPAHRWVRVVGAALAAVASVGWMANRVSGISNPIDRAMLPVTEFAPLGIFVLATIAIPAYFHTTYQRAAVTAQGKLNQ